MADPSRKGLKELYFYALADSALCRKAAKRNGMLVYLN